MAKFKERRATPKAARVESARADGPPKLRDDAGIHTMDAVHEFILYDLDGGAQTEWNERFVMPLCLAVVSVDGLAKLPNGTKESMLIKVGETLQKITRRADRLARSGDEYAVLLRRTLSKRAHDFYAPNAQRAIADALGPETTVTIGISSVTEHMIKGADDMIKKAFSALAAARKQGPGSTMVYDFRTMPY